MESNLQAILEGILFVVGDEGVRLERLVETLEMDEEVIQSALDSMISSYVQDDTRGVEIVCYGGCYKMVSKAVVHEFAQRLFESTANKGFSPAALETLAIIAYKQPITRAEIEEIRGVGCDMMIRKLLARNLIKEVGRTDAPGRPFLYGVTEAFMDAFQLQSLEELPELPDFAKEEESENLFG